MYIWRNVGFLKSFTGSIRMLPFDCMDKRYFNADGMPKLGGRAGWWVEDCEHRESAVNHALVIWPLPTGLPQPRVLGWGKSMMFKGAWEVEDSVEDPEKWPPSSIYLVSNIHVMTQIIRLSIASIATTCYNATNPGILHKSPDMATDH